MSDLKPIQLDVDLAQGVFDALDAYIAGTPWVSSNASVSFDGGGTIHTMNCNDRTQTGSFTYTQRSAGTRVSIVPNAASLGPGETIQFTATATGPDGVPVAAPVFTWAVSAGSQGTVSATGLYTAPAVVGAAGLDNVTATLTGEPSWASVTVQLHV